MFGKLLTLIGIVALILSAAIYLPLFGLPEETKEHIQTLSEDNPKDTDFIRAVWQDIKDTYDGETRCWKNYLDRDFIFSGNKIMALEGECLPCHQYNRLFQKYLTESNRFKGSQIKTITTYCAEATMLHFYTEVTLDNGEILNIDQWGADDEFGVPFGQTIYDAGVCTK